MFSIDTRKSRLAVLIVLLGLTIPSIICSLYIFYQFIRLRELRQRVNNHVVLVLLMITFLQVSTFTGDDRGNKQWIRLGRW